MAYNPNFIPNQNHNYNYNYNSKEYHNRVGKQNINEEENSEDYSFKVFKIYINLYILSKNIENKLKQNIQIREEYYLISLPWLQDFKKRFNYKELEKFFEEKCDSKNIQINLNNDIYIKKKFIESKFNQTKIKKDEFNKINKIHNNFIFEKSPDFTYYKEYAIINQKISDEMKNNNFYFDERPKIDIDLGNQSFILHVGKSGLECVFCNDYDSFIDEYLINFNTPENRINAEKNINNNGLQFYFNCNNINKNSCCEQYILDSSNNKINNKIATVNSININKKKEIKNSVAKVILNAYNKALSDSFQEEKKGKETILDAFSQIRNSCKNDCFNYNFPLIDYNQINYKEISYMSKIFTTKKNRKETSVFFSNFDPNKKKGLVNLGNSCYINVVLQSLFHIPELVKYFLKYNFNETQPLSFALNFFVKALYQPKNNNDYTTIYNPEFICQIIYKIN